MDRVTHTHTHTLALLIPTKAGILLRDSFLLSRSSTHAYHTQTQVCSGVYTHTQTVKYSHTVAQKQWDTGFPLSMCPNNTENLKEILSQQL